VVVLIDDKAKNFIKNDLPTGVFIVRTVNFVDVSTNSMSIKRQKKKIGQISVFESQNCPIKTTTSSYRFLLHI